MGEGEVVVVGGLIGLPYRYRRCMGRGPHLIRRLVEQARRRADRRGLYKVVEVHGIAGQAGCARLAIDRLPQLRDAAGGAVQRRTCSGAGRCRRRRLHLLVQGRSVGRKTWSAPGSKCLAARLRSTWRLSYPLLRSRSRSRSAARRMLSAIIRHVRFSMRSALGSWVRALEYSFQIWVPSGSFRCISSGEGMSAPSASFLRAGKMESASTPGRAAGSGGAKASVSGESSAVVCSCWCWRGGFADGLSNGGHSSAGEDDVAMCGSTGPNGGRV